MSSIYSIGLLSGACASRATPKGESRVSEAAALLTPNLYRTPLSFPLLIILASRSLHLIIFVVHRELHGRSSSTRCPTLAVAQRAYTAMLSLSMDGVRPKKANAPRQEHQRHCRTTACKPLIPVLRHWAIRVPSHDRRCPQAPQRGRRPPLRPRHHRPPNHPPLLLY